MYIDIDIYRIEKDNLQKIVGFNIWDYYNKDNFHDIINFYKIDNELVEENNKLTLYIHDLDEEKLKELKCTTIKDVEVYFRFILNYYISNYVDNSVTEPFMNEDTLKFKLKTIEHLKKLYDLFKDDK